MGTYVGIRGTIKLLCHHKVHFSSNLSDDVSVLWDGIILSNTAFMDDYRCASIPHGTIHDMPDEWEDNWDWNEKTGVITFSCSLKNYTNTIEKFIEVLPEFASAWKLETHHSETGISEFHEPE